MIYYEEFDGFRADELIGGTEYPVEVINVSLTSGASVHRGELLAGASGIYAPVASGEDAKKSLCIAADDFTADSLSAVTSAYAAGRFNREKIICAGGSVADFEFELRKQNIHLTGLRGE